MALNNKINSFLVPAQYGNLYNLYYTRVDGGAIGCNININGVNVNMAKNSSIDIIINTVSGGTGCYLSGDLPDVFGNINAPILSPIISQVDYFKQKVLNDNGFFESETCLITTLEKLNNIN